MKKVLALVLAVIMVCTMAMAITVQENGSPATSTTAKYAQLKPGSVLYFTIGELNGNGAVKTYYDSTTHEFVPEKNAVTVTFGKGAELVASKGWVRTVAKADTVSETSEATSWQYQIVLKDSDTAVCDEKTLDFSITGVSYKPFGDGKLEYSVDSTVPALKLAKFERDYGWKTGELALNPDGEEDINYGGDGFSAKFELNVITTLTGTTNNKGETVNTNKWYMTDKDNNDNTEVDFTVKAGQKVLRKNFDFTDAQMAKITTKYGLDEVNIKHKVVNDTNLVGTAGITHWSNKLNVYALAMDGTISKVSVTVEDGVAFAKVPAYSAVFVYEGALKNVTTTVSGSTTTETGTTTNPGTGANDVVGAAAALAVVALVSGAAISLKK